MLLFWQWRAIFSIAWTPEVNSIISLYITTFFVTQQTFSFFSATIHPYNIFSKFCQRSCVLLCASHSYCWCYCFAGEDIYSVTQCLLRCGIIFDSHKLFILHFWHFSRFIFHILRSHLITLPYYIMIILLLLTYYSGIKIIYSSIICIIWVRK